MARCEWAVGDPLMQRYHDEEWGVPVHEDRTIFEFLVLEAFQAGLSWRTVLHKREHFREAFAGFDARAVSRFTSRDRARLLKNAGIIRNRAKIGAAVHNAGRFLEVQRKFGNFASYMWSWVGGKPLAHRFRRWQDCPAYTQEAVAWSADLKTRGFQFLGPTVVYAHMQATGMVNDHVVACARYRDLARRTGAGANSTSIAANAPRRTPSA